MSGDGKAAPPPASTSSRGEEGVLQMELLGLLLSQDWCWEALPLQKCGMQCKRRVLILTLALSLIG